MSVSVFFRFPVLARTGVLIGLGYAQLAVVRAEPAASARMVATATERTSETGDMSADALVSSAQLALSLIDAGEFGRLWKLSTVDTKRRLPSPEFSKEMKEARASVGLISTRRWAGIARVRYIESPLKEAVPAGFYVNIEFASRQLDGGSVFELVTLRVEDDGSLKFAGYVPRFEAKTFAADVTDAK